MIPSGVGHVLQDPKETWVWIPRPFQGAPEPISTRRDAHRFRSVHPGFRAGACSLWLGGLWEHDLAMMI